MIRATPYELNNVPTTVPKGMMKTSSKRKSKFKKCPQAPKRFKSAYIFFSTEMMQTIKAKQKGGQHEKQKITDISKKISIAWKKLQPEERAKWNLIAKKDKERFLEEKKNYKGPWQLPVKYGNQQDEPPFKRKRGSVSSLSDSDVDQKYHYSLPLLNKNRTWKDNNTTCSSSTNRQNSNISRNLDKVSQEERDAAHNLVQLHMQSNSSASTSASTGNNLIMSSSNDSSETTDSHLSHNNYRDYNTWVNQQKFLADSNTVIPSSSATYYPTTRNNLSSQPTNFYQGAMYQLNQTSTTTGAESYQNFIEHPGLSQHQEHRNHPHHFKFARF